jgi:flagellar biosynthesis protein FlhG
LRTVDEFRPKIVINGARSADDIRLGFSVVTVCRRYFGANFKYLGYINYDEAVRRSVIAKVPLVHFAKEADAANYLTRIARKISEPPPAVSLGRHR